MKLDTTFACCGALLWMALATGCGSGMTGGAIRSPEYATYAVSDFWKCGNLVPGLLTQEPKEPHVIVGTIEVRTSRVKNATELRDELLRLGQNLGADALVPPPKSGTTPHSSLNPLQRYYVHDDGRTQILEAAAIRFPLDARGCRRGPGAAR